jgi:ACS family hexuronate transporter-like MFS transporter
MTDGVWWFYLFWLPKYLEVQFGLMKTNIMLPLAVLYSMTMLGSIGGGWLPSYFINKGMNPYDGRMRAMFFIALFPLLVLLAQPFGSYSYWVPVLLIGIGASAHQAWSCNIFTTVSDMFPKKSVASVVGIGGMAGGIGGVFLSKLGGWLFDYYGALGQIYTGYSIMFGICAVAYLIALGVMASLVPKYKAITDL